MLTDVEFKEACRQMGMIGRHSSYLRALEQARAYAKYDVNVLIIGESGVGRYSFAKLIHRLRHSESPYYETDCMHSEKFLRAELLGEPILRSGVDYVRHEPEEGVVERDTLILRDVHEVSAAFVRDLYSFLKGGSLGQKRYGKVCVVATARSKAESICVDEEALESFLRLFDAVIRVPSLSDRQGDVILLAQAFLEQWNVEHGGNLRFDSYALRKLEDREWPGNLQELRRVVESAAMLCEGDQIRARLVDPRGEAGAYSVEEPDFDHDNLDDCIDRIKKAWIDKALARFDGKNQAAAADLLGWSPQRLHKYLKSRQNAPKAH